VTILSLDLGKKRIGLAISHGIVAEGYTTLKFDERNPDKFLGSLEEVVLKEGIDKIIVGLPLGQDGKDTDQSVWTKSLAQKIEETLDLKVIFVEESYSTSQARDEGGDLDQQSARIILEQYLNETENLPL
jgi:putative Holliday junction resolvase